MRSLTRLGLAAVMLLLAASASAVEIEHELGTTNVPDAPQRVVVLEYSFVDSMAAIGMAPVGIADDNRRESIIPAYTDIIGDDWVSVGTRKSPSLEIIASLQPDLIIADKSRHSSIYGALSEIAPTLVFDSLTGTYETAMEAATTIGHALGQDEAMAQRLAQHNALMDDYKAQLGDVSGLSIQFFIDNGQGIYLHSPTSYNGSMLIWFGFDSEMTATDGETTYSDAIVQTSLEQLSVLDPDILIRGKYVETGLTDEWVGQPLFDNLTAVKNGRLFDIEAHNWSRLRGVIASEASAASLVEIVTQLER
ncbi:ABC transporter substrate-binding protein [Saccharospirillum mangrovi]|uniref:ABC transporter substrate-binding protein n=1 Tax=Saccharospirillum mangrovi TaxID=2161747 RepID=UPI001E315530|nr:Fe(3+) dicitrate ABC transporter substrate-binding protein [Saccharospirillum mangrovi]